MRTLTGTRQLWWLYRLQSPILHSSKVDDEVMNDRLPKLEITLLTVTIMKRSDTENKKCFYNIVWGWVHNYQVHVKY